jgi:hypothetical protein
VKKIFPVILTVFVVAALAGVLYVRANMDLLGGGGERSAVPADASDPTSLLYAVRSAVGEAEVRAYDFASGQSVDPDPAALGLRWPARYNQSSFICATADEAEVPTALRVLCDIGRDNVLLLAAYDGQEKAYAGDVDPRELGITPSAAEGYLVPVAVAADKSAIYLGRRVETESWVAGLWKVDVATGRVTEIAYVREHDLYQYDINPTTKQLLGVTFVPPESLGGPISGPSSAHLVDLQTGEGRSLELAVDAVVENPMLSDDALSYAFYESGADAGGGTGTARTLVLSMEWGRVAAAGAEVDGVMKDWFGDTVVFDRDGNLFLYDLKTETETRITNETDATVEYLGVTR